MSAHPIRYLRNAFFTGLLLLLPLGITIFVVNLLLKHIGGPASKLFFFFLDSELRARPWVDPALDIVSTLVVVAIITLIGLISRYFFGRIIVSLTESIVNAVPFINTVYNTVKQIVDTFSTQHRAVFKKVVLIEYPRKDIWAVGFLTSNAKGELQEKTTDDVVNVFMPTTPNPTSGFLLMVPKTDIIDLDMTIGDGMKLVISGGAVVPPNRKDIEEKKA